MSGRHTPGPWAVNETRYNRDYRTCLNVMTADGLLFVAAVSCDPHTDSAQMRANARLIAAAPELVEALRGLLGYEGHMVWCGHGDDMSKPCVCSLDSKQVAARALLAKIDGEAS